MHNKTILIAEDHPLVVKSLNSLLLDIDNQLNVLAVDSCKDLMNVFLKQKPKYIIIDMTLNDGFALTTLEQILLLDNEINIMVYTVASAKMYLAKLFSIGIHCFVKKENSEEELIQALKKFLNNEFYLSNDLLPVFISMKTNNVNSENIFKSLSKNEMIVVEYLKSGLSPKAISVKMNIKQNTVTTYKKRAFEKLGVINTIELKELYEARN